MPVPYQEMIEAKAYETSVDPAWVMAIIEQESQFNTAAVRFEPLFKYFYKPAHFAEHPLISIDTEIATQKMSWGLGQIMGALAREQGHQGFMAELLKPEVNLKHICQRLKFLKRYSHEAEAIFAAYNGGPGALRLIDGKFKNQNYVDSVLSHLKKYSK